MNYEESYRALKREFDEFTMQTKNLCDKYGYGVSIIHVYRKTPMKFPMGNKINWYTEYNKLVNEFNLRRKERLLINNRLNL